MSFSSVQVTAKGRILLAKAQTGTTINFTRIKMGDGTMTGQVIDDMTDTISQKANLSINAMKVLTGGKAKVQAIFTNQGLSTGFYWREIAVFATDPDNASNEIMYCYGNAGALAEYIPAEGSQILERVISVLTIISNAANVTATIDSSNVYLTPQDADVSYVKKSIATAASQFLVSSGVGTWVIKTIAEIKTLLGLGSSAYKEFNEAGGVASFDTVSSHLSDYVRQIGYGTTSGTANTYTLTLSPALSAYVAGVGVTVKINVANTGASTININGLGAKSILDSKGNAMTSGKLRLNGVYTLRYDGTNFILQGEGGSGNAIASDLLSGKTASTDAGDIVGTIPSKSAATITPSASVQTIAAGQYLSGTQTISAVTVPVANVLAGTTIAGQAGTIPVRTNTDTGGSYPNATNDSMYDGIIHLMPPAGYYDGSVWLKESIPNLTAANIRKDTVIGVGSGGKITGTLVPLNGEKKWASGLNVYASGGTLTVSGLAFRPKVVMFWQRANMIQSASYRFQAHVLFDDGMPYHNGSSIVTAYHFYSLNMAGAQQSPAAPDTTNRITTNGFSVPDIANYAFDWIAYA